MKNVYSHSYRTDWDQNPIFAYNFIMSNINEPKSLKKNNNEYEIRYELFLAIESYLIF